MATSCLHSLMSSLLRVSAWRYCPRLQHITCTWGQAALDQAEQADGKSCMGM